VIIRLPPHPLYTRKPASQQASKPASQQASLFNWKKLLHCKYFHFQKQKAYNGSLRSSVLHFFKGFKMKKLALLFIALLSVSALADDLPRIAVYVTGNVGDDEKKALGTRMLATLVNSGRYKGIERSNSFLAEIEKEQEKQRSGAIDDGQISALGKQFGVKFVCIADITPAFGDFQVSARIVNVETAEVDFIGESSGQLNSMDDLEQVSVKVVEKMFGVVTQGKLEPKTQEKSDVQEKKNRKLISAGVGWSYSLREDGYLRINLNAGKKDSWGYDSTYESYSNIFWDIHSIHAFLDVTYAEIGINLAFGYGYGDFDHRQLGALWVASSVTGLGISVFGKYPILVTFVSLDKPLGFFFPIVGVEYSMLLSGKSEYTIDYFEEDPYYGEVLVNSENGGYEWDGKGGNPKAGDYSKLYFKGGVGFDFTVIRDMFIRAEILFGIGVFSKAQDDAVKYYENLPNFIDAQQGLGWGIDVIKLCVGYKF
jgi:hypothetical protein